MILDIIKKRRSIFPPQYTNKPVTRESLELLLEAANWAPNHKKTEPWRFKVLTGETKEKLGLFLSLKYLENDPKPKEFKAKKLKENPQKSGAVIVINMQRDPKESLPEWEEIAAVSMAVQNMWLACTELGLGCYWSSPGLIKYMNEFLDYKEGEKCLGFFYVGHFEDELPEGERQPVAQKVEWFN